MSRDGNNWTWPEKERGRGRGRARGGRGGGEGRGRGGRGQAKGRGGAKDESNAGGNQEANTTQENHHDSEWWEGWEEYEEDWTNDAWGGTGWHWDQYAQSDAKQSWHYLSESHAMPSKPEQPSKNDKKEQKRSKGETSTTETEEKTKPKPKRSKTNKDSETKPAGKKRKSKEETQDAAASSAAEPKKAARRRKEATPEATPSEANPKHVKKIKQFFGKFALDKSTEATQEIKDWLLGELKLDSLTECRLNKYWKVPSCGVTSKSKKKDIAHFSFKDIPEIMFVPALALALKCAELFVPWVHAVFAVYLS